MITTTAKAAALFLRLALGAAYLSSVASRFQIWPESLGGGNWEKFTAYTASLNPWAPAAIIPLIVWIVTVAETVLGVTLVLGIRQRETGILSGVLLILFAFGMTLGEGPKSPFDYSVYTASAASFLLAALGESLWAVDNFLRKGIQPTAAK